MSISGQVLVKFVTLKPPKSEARNPKSELENTRGQRTFCGMAGSPATTNGWNMSNCGCWWQRILGSSSCARTVCKRLSWREAHRCLTKYQLDICYSAGLQSWSRRSLERLSVSRSG